MSHPGAKLAGMKAHDVDRLFRTLAEAQQGLVGRHQVRGRGVSRQAVRCRLESPDWDLFTERVLRLVGMPRTAEQRAMAATLDAGPGAVLSHTSAAALWRLRGFDLDCLQVSRSRLGTDRPTALATVHTPMLLPEHHRTLHRDIPVTTLARTVVDLATTEHPNRVEVALHAALRVGLRWKDLETTAADLDGRGRAGVAVVRSLIERHHGRRPLGSGLEARVLRLLLAAGLPEPRRQVDLGGHDWEACVDFLYEDARLVVEIDGGWCHETPADVRRDKRRTAALAAAGFRVLPISEDLIRRSPDEVVRLVREARRRAA